MKNKINKNNKGRYQEKIKHQINVKIKEKIIDGISWNKELILFFLSKIKIGIAKMINKISFTNDSQGVKLLPIESFIASPKQPQSSTHWTGIPEAVSPGTQVAVCNVKNVKKINIAKVKNKDIFILAFTINAKPNTISKTQIKAARNNAKGISHSKENVFHPKISWIR